MKKKASIEIQEFLNKKKKIGKDKKDQTISEKTKKNEKIYNRSSKVSAKDVSASNKTSKFVKSDRKGDSTNPKGAKPKKLLIKGKLNAKNCAPKKVEDWSKFKKDKKKLRLKRIQARTKENFDRIQQAKKMGEKVRLKALKEDERNKVVNQLHELLKGHYAKFVLAHDTSRIVQWLLKYSSDILARQISQELIPVVIDMLQSKYGIHCVKRLLKYGQNDIRSSVIDQMKGNAVKLATHTISSPVFEYAFSTWASAAQKQLLIQEFFGDLYKNSKDPNVKHLRDVYKDNESMKAAILGACKSNIKKVLNKSLLDSGLLQSVLCQFLQECSAEDRKEIISELAPHIVVISNSKDGSRAAMQCVWNGTNKDKKVLMKALKEHVVDLSKHEYGHCTVIALLDSIDDTVLLHKLILSEILNNAKDLAVSEWGKKVLLWLVSPGNLNIFHPLFITELTQGRESSNCKKSLDTRRKEILSYSISTLLMLVIKDVQFWLSNASLATKMLTIIKAGDGELLEKALTKIVETITDADWKIKEGEKIVSGIESAGLHMTLKKLAQHDIVALAHGRATFGICLMKNLTDEVIRHWLKINRACFILIAVFENNDKHIQALLRDKLKPHLEILNSENTPGANILLKKM